MEALVTTSGGKMSAERQVEEIYEKVLVLESGTTECNVFFEKLGLDNPTQRELTFFRVALLIAAKAVR